MFEIRELLVGGQKVVLDPNRLEFNEATLSKYLEQEGAWYDYFGQKLADAEYELAQAEESYEKKYSVAFRIAKEEGSSDKLAESTAKCDTDVQSASVLKASCKHKVKLLSLHLKAWDKNHDNAQSRGHTLRKEMDKLSGRIYGPTVTDDWSANKQIEEMFTPAEKQAEDK